jgi:hypothetical protein
MMMMMMMMLCKSRAQVRDLCVEINNFKLPVMQKTPIFTTFSARRKMAAEKRGQIKVFGRNITNIPLFADEIPIFFTFTTVPMSGHRWNGARSPKWEVLCSLRTLYAPGPQGSRGWQRGTLGFHRETSVKYISIPRDVGFVGE